MARVIQPSDIPGLVPDGATLGAAVITLSGWPEAVAIALEAGFLATGHPRALTLAHASGAGDWKTKGTQHFAHPGMIARWIGGHTGLSPAMARMILDGEVQGHCLPQGVICQLWREIAAKRPGVITKTGLGTFVDPRLEGGRMSPATQGDRVRVLELDGEEWLFYPSFPVDVAMIRATTADTDGNLTMEDEGVLLESLPLAQAARNSGGIVIAQVEHLAEAGTLHPKDVRIPGILVDYILVAPPEHHWQAAGTYKNPSFSGNIRIPLGSIPPWPLDERMVIARRAAMELEPGAVVNLGIGVPDAVAMVAAGEGAADLLTLTTELGVIGGVPAGGENFGMSFNPSAFVEHHAQFDWYDGGGLDIAFLGAAEMDRLGNVNVSKFKGRCVGCGGFINITQNAKKVVFCGTFTAGGLRVEVGGGRLRILHEGSGRKFVEHVEQVTFSGAYAAKVGQPALYVTERAVFELRDGRLTLTEIAPGVDLERDVLALMDFRPAIAPGLRTMPEAIFRETWGGLREHITARRNAAAPEPVNARTQEERP